MDEININTKKHPKSPANKTAIIVIFSIIVGVIIFISIISSISSTNNYLTYENYMDIHNGMTYSEVVEVLDGHQGELTTSAGYGNYSLSYYTWTNSSGTRTIVIGFENGKVTAKSQYGLN